MIGLRYLVMTLIVFASCVRAEPEASIAQPNPGAAPGPAAMPAIDAEVHPAPSVAPSDTGGASSPRTAVRLAELRSVTSLAVDDTALYVTDTDRNDYDRHATNVVAIPLAGGRPRIVARDQRGAYGLVAGRDLAWLTLTDLDSFPARPPRVMALAGRRGRPAPIAVASDGGCGVWPGNCNLAADERGLFLPGDGAIRARASGGREHVVSTFHEADLTGLTMAIDDANVYWIESPPAPRQTKPPPTAATMQLWTAPREGGPSRLLAEVPALNPQRLASDGAHVFLTDSGRMTPAVPGAIWRIPVGGGSAERLASTTAPWALAIDDDAIYWTTHSERDGAIFELPKRGGTPEQLIGGQSYPESLAVRAGFIYWANYGDGTVWRIPR